MTNTALVTGAIGSAVFLFACFSYLVITPRIVEADPRRLARFALWVIMLAGLCLAVGGFVAVIFPLPR